MRARVARDRHQTVRKMSAEVAGFETPPSTPQRQPLQSLEINNNGNALGFNYPKNKRLRDDPDTPIPTLRVLAALPGSTPSGVLDLPHRVTLADALRLLPGPGDKQVVEKIKEIFWQFPEDRVLLKLDRQILMLSNSGKGQVHGSEYAKQGGKPLEPKGPYPSPEKKFRSGKVTVIPDPNCELTHSQEMCLKFNDVEVELQADPMGEMVCIPVDTVTNFESTEMLALKHALEGAVNKLADDS